MAREDGPALGCGRDERKQRAVITLRRLFVSIVLEAAQHEAGAPDQPPRDSLGYSRHLVRKMDIDDRRPVFGRGPAAELVLDDLQDLEPGKDIVIDAGPEGEVEFRLNSELMDFRWPEGRHAASVHKG